MSTGCTVYELIALDVFYDLSLTDNLIVEAKISILDTLDILKRLLNEYIFNSLKKTKITVCSYFNKTTTQEC